MNKQSKTQRRGRSLTAVSLLTTFGLMLLSVGVRYTPSASGASAYPFPGRGDGKILHSAHMQPGSIPASLCPYNAQYVADADNKQGEFPVETFIPEGRRPKVRQGDLIGRVGNSGASSGPHLHVHLKTVEEGDELSTAVQMLFYGAKVKSTTKLADSPADWVALTNDALSWPQAILPNNSLNNLKAKF